MTAAAAVSSATPRTVTTASEFGAGFAGLSDSVICETLRPGAAATAAVSATTATHETSASPRSTNPELAPVSLLLILMILSQVQPGVYC